MPVALDHAIRFAAGARLVFTPGLAEPVLGALARIKPDYKALFEALPAGICTVESIDADSCALRLAAGEAACRVRIRRDGADTYAVAAEFRTGAGEAARCASRGGLAIMLGGTEEVLLAERGANGVRYWLKLRYEASLGGVSVRFMTAGVLEQMPVTLRALAPSELVLGKFRPMETA